MALQLVCNTSPIDFKTGIPLDTGEARLRSQNTIYQKHAIATRAYHGQI